MIRAAYSVGVVGHAGFTGSLTGMITSYLLGRRERSIRGEPFDLRQLEYFYVRGAAADQSVHVRPLTLGKAVRLFKLR